MLLAKKNFKFHAWLQKCHFGKIEKNCTFEPVHNMSPGSAKSRIYAGKSTKRGFSKKALARIEKKNVLGSYESLEGLER